MTRLVLPALLVVGLMFTKTVSVRESDFSGDAKRCLSNTSDVIVYEALPGSGFDNLRNKILGMVVNLNYSQCLVTDDQTFLIPDSVHMYPLKTSHVDVYSELIDHWTNFTSTTSKSINIDAGLSMPHYSISGTFSDEYSTVKTHQFEDKAMTTRVQLRYARYTARLQPNTELHPTFKDRLMHIGAHVLLNDTKGARYESQLLVRDYGTHVITSVDGGAALSQIDQIKSKFVADHKDSKGEILATASASFFEKFNIGSRFETTTKKAFVDQYVRSRTRSTISTHGGMPFKAGNFTANDWTDSIDNNLVPLDISGDPLYFIITPRALPELSPPTVFEVAKYVQKAVELYYRLNIHYGCTDRDSPNFSFQANVEDGSCKAPQTNFTFGGVYQECSMSRIGDGDLCHSMNQRNPRTGGFSCPKNYKSILLTKGTLRSSRVSRDCYNCYIFFDCCHHNTRTSTGSYRAYWCVAIDTVHQESGYLFGGIFTNKLANPVTKQYRCPPDFYPLRLGHSHDIAVCVSDDYELGYGNSVPFAGFFSCLTGNPLAYKTRVPSSNNTRLSTSQFLYAHGPTSWPHRCPNGYSQHTAAFDNGCEVEYCVLRNALRLYGLPPVRRPPYAKAPQSTAHWHKIKDAIVGPGNKIYTVDEATAFLESHSVTSEKAKDKTVKLSDGSILAFSVVAALVCIIVATTLLVRHKRKKMATRDCYTNMDNQTECPVNSSTAEPTLPVVGIQGYGTNNSASISIDA